MQRIVVVVLIAALAVGCANRQYTFRIDDVSDQTRVTQYRDQSDLLYRRAEK